MTLVNAEKFEKIDRTDSRRLTLNNRAVTGWIPKIETLDSLDAFYKHTNASRLPIVIKTIILQKKKKKFAS